MWEKPSILMLGWEYPPYLNGGLGVACQGIANALAAYVKLTLVLPKTLDEKKTKISLVSVEEELLVAEPAQLDWIQHSIPVALNPYETVSILDDAIQLPAIEASGILSVPTEKTAAGKGAGELYGSNLLDKVARYTQAVLEKVEDTEFELIHAHDWMTFPAALALKEKSAKPLILHSHSTEYDRSGAESRTWVYQLEKKAFEAADVIIVVSHYAARILNEHYGISPSKIEVVHNATNPIATFKTSKHFPERLVTFMGRITRQKAPFIFLEVAQRVLEQYDNVRFVVAGKGDQTQALMDEVASRRIGHRFHFTGFLDRAGVQQLLSMTDIFVMPSVSDPFGIAALEAAQFGIPCVVSRQSGVLEVLRGALTADWDDVNLLTEYVLTLLKHPNMAEEIGKNTQKSIENLTWDEAVNKILKVYARELKGE